MLHKEQQDPGSEWSVHSTVSVGRVQLNEGVQPFQPISTLLPLIAYPPRILASLSPSFNLANLMRVEYLVLGVEQRPRVAPPLLLEGLDLGGAISPAHLGHLLIHLKSEYNELGTMIIYTNGDSGYLF